MSRIPLPRPALIVAIAALVLAMAGGAWAVKKAPKNSVVSKSVKNNALKSADIKNESLKGFDIKDRSLEGKDVKDESLGGEDVKDGTLEGADIKNGSIEGADVMDATLSGIDMVADSLTGAQIDESTLVGVDADKVDGLDAACGEGTQPFLGACWETASRAVTNWDNAAAVCATAGGELPSPAALRAFAGQPGITLAGADEWTEQIYDVTAVNAFSAVTVSATGGINFTNAQADAKGFRCVLPLLK